MEIVVKESSPVQPRYTISSVSAVIWQCLVAFAGFLLLTINEGMKYSFGVIFDAFLRSFHNNRSTVAWIPSIMQASSSISGILASVLINKHGPRAVAVSGILLNGVGLMVSSSFPNVYMLFFSCGFCTGVGFGFTFLAVIVYLTSYFKERRALVFGIAYCGIGVGITSNSYLIEYLEERYELKTIIIIVAGIILSTLLAAIIFRPIPLCVDNRGYKNFLPTVKILFEDKKYICFVVFHIMLSIGVNVPYVYTKNRVVVMGLTEDGKAGFLMLLIGIFDSLGRLTSGFVASRIQSPKGRLLFYSASLILTGLSTCLSCLAANYYHMAVYCVVCGLSSGSIECLISVVVIDLVGLENFSIGYGIILASETVPSLFGEPLTGLLFDIYGSYDPGFILAGGMIALDGLLLFFIPCIGEIKYGDQDKEPVQSTRL